MQIAERILRLHEYTREHHALQQAPFPPCVLFFSVSDSEGKAEVLHAVGKDFSKTWSDGLARLRRRMQQRKLSGAWLRIDWPVSARSLTWERFLSELRSYRRNYFRYGLALDPAFRHALLEQECNANGIFYGDEKDGQAAFNPENFLAYASGRFKATFTLPLSEQREVCVFDTAGVFCAGDGILHELPSAEDESKLPPLPAPLASCGSRAGLYTGRRHLPALSHEILEPIIRDSSRFLAKQIKKDGNFIYGYLPCFGRRLTSYNTVRHAGTVFALLEAWEHTGDDTLKPAIDASVNAIVKEHTRRYTLDNGEAAVFLLDKDDIKLGGNGVALVALSRWTELTGNREHVPFMEELARGIAYMQNKDTGGFVHELYGKDLSVKSEHRVVYYDGEALFGLLRLYGITRNPQWLEVAEKALEAFILDDHWKAHDHWLSYAANEMTLYRQEDRFFRFGLRNMAGHLDFVLQRETTYPTLLELSMAAEKMVRRIESLPDKLHLLAEIDLAKFRLASHRRAEYLLNGYGWPEMAMYFQLPRHVSGGFFIRHHAFRVRIDDVAHYLCGLIAYDKLFGRKYPCPDSISQIVKAQKNAVWASD